MSDTALDLDLAALVGELEDVACELDDHATDLIWHDDGPATHYLRAKCPTCGDSAVRAVCQRLTDAILRNVDGCCGKCGADIPASSVTILGPVNGRAS